MKKILNYKEFHSTSSESYVKRDDTQVKLVGEFNQKVKNGDIEFEYLPCLCGSTNFDLVASLDRYSMLQKTVLCKKCGLIQSNPRMTPDEYFHFYSSDFYRKCYDSDSYLHLYESKYTPKTGQHIFDEVNKIKPTNSGISVLEVGAGGGWNLLPFAKSGAKVLGIDYSDSLVSLGREHGIDMTKGGIDEIEGLFGIIIINHALEHFLNPVESLKRIVSHLKKDGVIYIAVPNIINFCMGQLQNAHTYYFDPETLVYYCSLSGLKLLASGSAQEIHMFGIFEIGENNFTKSNLKNHYEEIRCYLRNMMFKHYIKQFLARFHLDKTAQKLYRKFYE